MKIPCGGSQTAPTRQELLSSHLYQDKSPPYTLLSLPEITISKMLRTFFIFLTPYFQQMRLCSQTLPQRKTEDWEAKWGDSRAQPGGSWSAKEEQAAAGGRFFSCSERCCICPSQGTACWPVTSCLWLWRWFGVSTSSSWAAQKFHLPVLRLLMFMIYPTGHWFILM